MTAFSNRQQLLRCRIRRSKKSKPLVMRLSQNRNCWSKINNSLLGGKTDCYFWRLSTTRRKGPERIAEVQRALNSLGFDSGKPDGYVGRNTVVAIKSFQIENQLKVTGELSDALIAKIFEAAGLNENQHAQIYIKQNSKEIFSAPVKLKYPEKQLGTHMFTVMNFESSSNSGVWNAVTIRERKSANVRSRRGRKSYPMPVADATIRPSQVLDRVELPLYVKIFISDRLTPGSSMIISDNGISHESGKYTDYIVLTR